LNERFSDYNENEVYLFPTFLDSNFGVIAFSVEMKLIVKGKILTLLKVESLKQQASCEKTVLNNTDEHAAVQKRKMTYSILIMIQLMNQIPLKEKLTSILEFYDLQHMNHHCNFGKLIIRKTC
jgi:hypothetical protein